MRWKRLNLKEDDLKKSYDVMMMFYFSTRSPVVLPLPLHEIMQTYVNGPIPAVPNKKIPYINMK